MIIFRLLVLSSYSVATVTNIYQELQHRTAVIRLLVISMVTGQWSVRQLVPDVYILATSTHTTRPAKIHCLQWTLERY